MQEMEKVENIVMAHFRNFLRFHVARRFEHRVRHQGSVGGGGDSKRPRQFVMIKLQQGDLASLSAATPQWDISAFKPSLFSHNFGRNCSQGKHSTASIWEIVV